MITPSHRYHQTHTGKRLPMNATVEINNVFHGRPLMTRTLDSRVVMTTLLSFGIIVNNTLILVIVKRQRVFQSKVASQLVTVLSILDIGLGILIATNIPHLVFEKWMYGDTVCRTIMCLTFGIYGFETYTIALISLERYLAICKPFQYRRMMNKRTLLIAATVIGVNTTVILSVPVVTELPMEVVGGVVCVGVLHDTNSQIYNMLCALFVICLPVFVVMIANLQIIKIIRKQRYTIRVQNGQHAQPVVIDKGSFISALLVAIIIFTDLPITFIVTINMFTNVRISLFWPIQMIYSSGFWNIYVYTLWNKAFRQALMRLIQCHKGRIRTE